MLGSILPSLVWYEGDDKLCVPLPQGNSNNKNRVNSRSKPSDLSQLTNIIALNLINRLISLQYAIIYLRTCRRAHLPTNSKPRPRSISCFLPCSTYGLL